MRLTVCPAPAPRPEERWAYTHIPPTTREEDIPSEHDVFEAVAAAEEESLAETNLNFNLKAPMTTNTNTAATTVTAKAKTKRAPKVHTLPADKPVAAAVADVVAPTMPSYHNYFDPLDTLEDNLGLHPVVHSRVLNSAAWMLDMSCINAARNILFTRYAEAEMEGDDPFNVFCQGVCDAISHESFYSGEEDTPEKVLATLLALREQWHDAAAAAYAADNKDYNPKSLDDLLLSEKPRTADLGTRANYEAIARAEARGDEAKMKRFLDAFLEADRINALQRVDGNKKLIPTLSAILATVGRHAQASSRFDDLPVANQRKLTQAILKSFDRIKLDVAKALARETIMFGHVLEAMYQCTEALSKILATKYSEAGELENTAMPHSVTSFDRRQKALAAARS